jgi:hypothetical protein
MMHNVINFDMAESLFNSQLSDCTFTSQALTQQGMGCPGYTKGAGSRRGTKLSFNTGQILQDYLGHQQNSVLS